MLGLDVLQRILSAAFFCNQNFMFTDHRRHQARCGLQRLEGPPRNTVCATAPSPPHREGFRGRIFRRARS